MGIKTDILVVSPVRNEERRIGALIDSLTKQTYQNWHLLVYDNGSDDESAAIVGRKMTRDHRISLVADDKLVDATSNINRALDFARGNFDFKFILIIGGDDELAEENFLAESIKEMENGASMVVPQYELFKINEGIECNESLIFPEKFKFSKLRIMNRINHSIHFEYGNMFYSMYTAEDFYRIFDDPRSKLIGVAGKRNGTNFSSDWWFTNTTLRLLESQVTYLGHITYKKYMKDLSYSDEYYFPGNIINEIDTEKKIRGTKIRIILTNVLVLPTLLVFSKPKRFRNRYILEVVFLWSLMVVTRITTGLTRRL